MVSEKRKEKRTVRHLLRVQNSGGFKPEHPATDGSWKPGESGNPAGRRKGPTFSSILREALTRKRKYKRKGIEFESSELELIVERAIKELRTGITFDVRLLSVLLDRLEGKVREPLELVGEGGGPIQYRITVVSEKAQKLLNKVLDGEGTE